MKFTHYSDIPANVWRWRCFTPQDIACRHCGEIIIDDNALDKLEQFLIDIGQRPAINCGYRCAVHNASAAVGGKPFSMHKFGRAFDISVRQVTRRQVLASAQHVGFTGLGFYNTFLHMDTGRRRQWGQAWT